MPAGLPSTKSTVEFTKRFAGLKILTYRPTRLFQS
jgi:hypothetical protein